jgi:endonuclease/exonuclease/phosphatase family metal-dependent hydrolase
MFERRVHGPLAGVVFVAALASCAPMPSRGAVAPPPDCRTPAASKAGVPVGWVLPPDPSDWPVNDAWCAAVGAPLKHEVAGLGEPVLDSLLVVTWNVNVGGGDLLAFVAALRAGALTGGRAVEHFVLLLQEAYRAGAAVPLPSPGTRGARRIATAPPAGPRLDIGEVAGRLGLALFYVPSMRNGVALRAPAEDRGNAILSTLPLVDLLAIELPFEAQRRVGAAATIRFRDGEGEERSLRVVNVHLDLRSRASRGLASLGAARARQAQAAALAVQSFPSSVFGGDLNTWAPLGLEAAPDLLVEYYPDTPESDGRPTFITAGVVPRRLDHLFFRLQSGFASAPARIDRRFGSDHHPVAAWISYPAAQASVTTPSPAPRAACCGPGTDVPSMCPSGC